MDGKVTVIEVDENGQNKVINEYPTMGEVSDADVVQRLMQFAGDNAGEFREGIYHASM